MFTKSDWQKRLVSDERGAIMVMGIFMCSCLVGALWYLAGIGDAIIYRERLQEAADAYAFSDAALHARGMNLIVLLNLVMAIVLSVRVALRAAKAALIAAAAIFAAAGIFFPALFALAAPAAEAAVTVDDIDKSLKEPIDETLKGLNLAQEAIASATPLAARVSSRLRVADRYRVAGTALIEPGKSLSDMARLPVEKRNPGKLCGEAATVIPKLVSLLFKKIPGGAVLSAGLGVISPLLEELADSGQTYFCGLEDGGSPPSAGGALRKAANERCKEPDKLDEKSRFQAAEKKWIEKCTASGVTCSGGPGGAGSRQVGQVTGPDAQKKQNLLDRLQLERDLAEKSTIRLATMTALTGKGGEGNPLTRDECAQFVEGGMVESQKENEKLSQRSGDPSASYAPSAAARDIKPMLVKDFTNGSERGQFFAGARGNPAAFRRDSKLVRIGTFGDKRTVPLTDPAAASRPSIAQAEFFFDCGGKWKDEGCDGDDDAMWHFKWRARLRRVNQSVDTTVPKMSLELGTFAFFRPFPLFAGEVAVSAAAPLFSGLKANLLLRKELVELAADEATRNRGVH